MKKTIIYTISTIFLVAVLSGCNNMSRQDRGTLVGAGVGAVAGGALTDSAGGAVGGAVVGGVVGRAVTRDNSY